MIRRETKRLESVLANLYNVRLGQTHRQPWLLRTIIVSIFKIIIIIFIGVVVTDLSSPYAPSFHSSEASYFSTVNISIRNSNHATTIPGHRSITFARFHCYVNPGGGALTYTIDIICLYHDPLFNANLTHNDPVFLLQSTPNYLLFQNFNVKLYFFRALFQRFCQFQVTKFN